MNKVADFSAGNYTIGATKRGEVWSWGRFQASRESVGEAFFNELFRRCFFNAYFRPPTFRDSLRTPGVALGTEMKTVQGVSMTFMTSGVMATKPRERWA